jgi:hypothetical protein
MKGRTRIAAQEKGLKMFWRIILCLSVLGGLARPAQGQYLWGRDSGNTVFSDGRYAHVAVDGNEAFVVGSDSNRYPVIEKLDSLGRGVWTTNGAGIRCITGTGARFSTTMGESYHFVESFPAGEGEVVVLWGARHPDNASYARIFGQRFSASGERLWDPNGVEISTETLRYDSTKTGVSLGTNGVVAVWTSGTGVQSMRAARLDPTTGTNLWLVYVVDTTVAKEVDACADEQGGILCAQVVYGATAHTSSVQRIGADGARLWGDKGVLLPSGYNDLYLVRPRPRVAADGTGGAAVLYGDYGASGSLWVQHLDAAGTPTWAAGGVPVCTNGSSVTIMSSRLVRTEPGAYVAVWSDNRTGNYDVYAQKISGTGTVEWTANGITVCNAPEDQAGADETETFALDEQLQALPDGEGGVWIGWLSKFGLQGFYLQHFDANGVPRLSATLHGYSGGMPVSIGGYVQYCPSLALRSPNHVLAAWDDSSGAIFAGAYCSGAPAITSATISAGTVGDFVIVTNISGITLCPGAQVYLQGPGGEIASAADVTVDEAGSISCTFDLGEDWTARESSRQWRGLACSDDGARWLASASSDRLYTSADGADTWSARADALNWRGVAASSDGRRALAAAYGGMLYVSDDYGAAWSPRDANRTWMAVASSADGRRLLAAALNDTLYRSSDYGATWSPVETNRPWYGVASSTDGARLVAVAGGPSSSDALLVSSDYGATWAARDGVRQWRAVSSSADGRRLAAVVYGGQIHVSSDYGMTWNACETNRYWTGIASSADGLRLAACAGGSLYADRVYLSSDAGATWSVEGPDTNWVAISCSDDGRRIVAAAYEGQLYSRVIEPTAGAWLLTVRNTDGQTATFPFQVLPVTYPAATLGRTIASGLQLLGNPFGVATPLSGLSLTNGTRGATFFDGDNIMLYHGNSGVFSNYWLDISGEWVDNNGPATNVIIEPGDGFWYRSRGGAFPWDEPRPW